MRLSTSYSSFVVHTRCGTARGRCTRYEQDCPCAPVQQPPGVFGRFVDLCAVCGHGLAVSGSPFTSLACRSCERVERALREALGACVLPLQRCRVLDGRGGSSGEPRQPYRPLTADLWPVACDLVGHGRRVVQQLSRGLELEEVPLELWQQMHPEDIELSIEVYSGLLNGPLPHRARALLAPTRADER